MIRHYGFGLVALACLTLILTPCSTGEDRVARFVDNGDGTVTDNLTGLMWQKNPGGYVSWKSALAICENLELAEFNDWRLPNIKELVSVRDGFNLGSDWLWSSTTNKNFPNEAWRMAPSGTVNSHYKMTAINQNYKAVRNVND